MPEMVLPGTYIEVRPEGLIAPGQVTVGNVGVLGTAAKGPVAKPVLLSNYNDALSVFGSYDAFFDNAHPPQPRADSLTLVRALELAFAQGASTVYAVRVAAAGAATAKAVLASASGDCVELDAASPGTWGNDTTVVVSAPDAADFYTVTETTTIAAAADTSPTAVHATGPMPLAHAAQQSARNRVSVRKGDGSVVYPTFVTATPSSSAEVNISGSSLTWGTGMAPGDVVTVDYVADNTVVAKVTLANGTAKETYLAISGTTLAAQINDPLNGSQLAVAVPAAHPGELPKVQNHLLGGGANGETGAVYSGTNGLDTLLDVDAHIIVAAGQSDAQAGADLDAHCQKASTDVYQRDRIAVVGSAAAGTNVSSYVDRLIGNTLASDRVIFVAPGIATNSSAPAEPTPRITLPGTYTAAAIAGMVAALSPHISLTNKTVSVADLEVRFNNAQLTELVQNRVTAIEVHRGIHVLRGQTTSDGPFREITTRRIVDYAKYGVRSAAAPYIGLLNNDRVRGALRATINSFLAEMLNDEMLVNYSLEVTATRDQQIAGIAQVTITLQPVFSINFIKVTMVLS